jgi:hypothetical protein
MKTPAQAWEFANRQLDTDCVDKATWHWGKMEAAQLLEFIYELPPGTPFDKEENK